MSYLENQISDIFLNDEGRVIKTKDFLRLCLHKWYYFLFSFIICMSIAVWYLLRTPKSYTRGASILVKQEMRGRNAHSDISSQFSNLGILTFNSSVNDEVINFQSPNLMYDVVKRLDLNINYSREGAFHDEVLYGSTLPLQVKIKGLRDNDVVSLTIAPRDKNSVIIKNLSKNGFLYDGARIAKFDESLRTPIGEILVEKTKDWPKKSFDYDIHVNRYGYIQTMETYCSRLKVELQEKQANVINLTFVDVNIQRAEDVLSTLINVYNERWIEDKNRISLSTNEFIAERLKVIECDLGNVDNIISSYKSNTMTPDLIASAKMDMEQSAEANRELMNLNNQLSVSRYLLNHIRGHKDQLIPANAGLEESNIQGMINQYNTIQLQRNRLAGNSSEENLLVKDMDQQLSQLRSAVISSIDNYIASLNMRIGSSMSMRAGANARISANPRQAGKLLSDERQQKVKESLYLFLLQKREENELSQAFTSYNTRVIVTPDRGGSFRPTSPKKMSTLSLAFILSIFLPAFLLYFKEKVNTMVRSRADIASISAPFVGEIPLVGSLRKKSLSRRKKDSDTSLAIVVKKDSRDIVNEALRVLRTNIEFMNSKTDGAYIMMVVSANSGSGKTFITANLGAVFALKKQTCIAH